MSSYFHNKVVVVTGGSQGIGRAIIEALLPHGAKIATCGRNQEALQLLQQELQSTHLFCVKADISIADEAAHFIQSTINHFGGIDILINNAGISMRGDFRDTDVAVIERLMQVNFMGMVYTTKFALESIIARKGDIAGISSIAGYRGLPGRSGYSASKFAMNGWLESLRTELSVSGVNVLWIAPGYTQSKIREQALTENASAQGNSPLNEQKLMSAETCAQHILHAIAKRKRTLVLSFQGKQTIFISKFFPRWADKLIRKFFYKNGKLTR